MSSPVAPFALPRKTLSVFKPLDWAPVLGLSLGRGAQVLRNTDNDTSRENHKKRSR